MKFRWLLCMTACLLGWQTAFAEGDRPNVVVILVDDLGIECVSSYGGKSYETPNLDRLTSQGMRFTHAFSNPYCSPSRASLLTGRYSFQHGMKIVIYNVKQHANVFVKTDQPSFARQLQKSGYATAIAGKWQLSFLHQRDTIRDFGFDQYQCWQIFRENDSKTRRFHQPHFNRNGTVIAAEIAHRYGPDVNVEFLIEFMKNNSQQGRPFLAYYTCLLPHFPWVPTPDSEDQTDPLKKATGQGNQKFFPDMVKYMDKNVGRIMKALHELGVEDNTLLIFVADNGTDQRIQSVWGEGAKRKTIRGGKGTMTDRGTRVPLIVRWPGYIEPGSTSDDLVDFSDLFPTLCELTGAPLPEQKIHGQSFANALLGKPGNPRQWVHIQKADSRHIRNRDYILTNKNELRPVVEIGEPTAASNQNKQTEKERAARETLQAVFDELGK